MKHTSKLLSVLLTLALVLGLLPWSVLPARATGEGTAEDPWQIGASGGDVKAVLSNGTLTISGTGAMQDFDYASTRGKPAYIPWTEEQSTITKVVIEDGVTSIGADSFYYCARLTSISIPKSVSSIGDRVFCRCGALNSLTVDKDNESYKIEDGVLFSKNGDTLYVYPSAKTGDSYAIPTGVKTVKEYAFYYSNLKSVTIPNTVTSVESRAFEHSLLESVVFEGGGTGTELADFAFGYCSELVSASLNGVTSIGKNAFDWCESLESVSLDFAASVDEDALYRCTALEEITITLSEDVYPAGNPVSVSANYNITIDYDGGKRVFKEWVDVGELVFTSGSATTADVSFIMPEGGVSLTAIFWKPLKPSTVAMVGKAEYDTLRKAISDVGSGTVKLVKDVTVGEYFFVNSGKDITIDLNNHGILNNGSSITAFVVKSGKLTLVDNAKRKTTHYILLNSDGRATEVKTTTDDIPEDTKYLTVYGGYISGGYMTCHDVNKGSSVYASGVFNQGTFIMEGGTICGNQTEASEGTPFAYGAGVYVSPDGEFIMKGGTICNNVVSMAAADSKTSVSVYGAGVYVDGKFIMEGGTIRDNVALTGDRNDVNATALGGGVYVAGSFEISGCPVVSGNTEGAENENGQFTGGVESNVYLASGKTITVTDAVDKEASIGVRTETNGEFAQAADNYNGGRLSDVSCFSSDAGFPIQLSGRGRGIIGEISTVCIDGEWDADEDKNEQLTAIVTTLDDDVLLIVAVYDNSGRQVMNARVVKIESACVEFEIKTGIKKAADCTYKLMLVRKSSCVPLCEAWSEDT